MGETGRNAPNEPNYSLYFQQSGRNADRNLGTEESARTRSPFRHEADQRSAVKPITIPD
jgi:hypothetical protein